MGMKIYHMADWKGKRINKLTITGVTARASGRKTLWECTCDCGSTLYVAPDRIVKGKTQSCRECYYKRVTGVGSANYKGSEHIPGRVLSALTKGAYRRAKDISVEVTIDDLERQWITQDGLCAYTGLPLSFSCVEDRGDASVDRIDSDEGYTPGNIQFVHKLVNRMKNDMSEDEFLLMCKLVTKHVSRDEEVTIWA